MTEQQWCCGCMQWLPLEHSWFSRAWRAAAVPAAPSTCGSGELRTRSTSPPTTSAVGSVSASASASPAAPGSRLASGVRPASAALAVDCGGSSSSVAVGEKAPASRSPENRVGRAAV
jgi:hypothetical protein